MPGIVERMLLSSCGASVSEGMFALVREFHEHPSIRLSVCGVFPEMGM